jgi:hypothetical protein
MRIDQFIGLNKWAKRKVRATKRVREVGRQIEPSGKEVEFDRTVLIPRLQKCRYSKLRGAYKLFVGDLHRYTLANGQVLEEYLQATMHSGGPCYFLALRDSSGKPLEQSLWTKEELDRA